MLCFDCKSTTNHEFVWWIFIEDIEIVVQIISKKVKLKELPSEYCGTLYHYRMKCRCNVKWFRAWVRTKNIVEHLNVQNRKEYKGHVKMTCWLALECFLAVKHGTMWTFCSRRTKIYEKAKQKSNVQQKRDQEMKWGNDINMKIVRTYFGDSVHVQLQWLDSIFCCERTLRVRENALWMW